MKKWKKRKKLTYLILTSLVLTVVIGVVSYAWLVHYNAMTTMAPVISTGNIAITGPDGKAIELLDLSYSNDDIKTDDDGNKRVTIQREISIKSTEDSFELEIVHTTNMKGLEFSLFKDNVPLTGKFLNLRNTTFEGRSFQYNYANDAKHTINFDEYSNVQVHAEPLYWKADGPLSSNKDKPVIEMIAGEEVTYYLTDYVLSITWIEENKETDIFYLLAKNVENNGQDIKEQ